MKVNAPIPPTHPQPQKTQHLLSQPPGPRWIAPKPIPLTGVSIRPKPIVTMATSAVTITTASGIGQLRPQIKYEHTVSTIPAFTTSMTSSSSMTTAARLGKPTLGPPLTNILLDLPSPGATHSAGSNLSDLSFSSTDLNSAKILSSDSSVNNGKNMRVDDEEERKVIADIKHLNEEEKQIVHMIEEMEDQEETLTNTTSSYSGQSVFSGAMESGSSTGATVGSAGGSLLSSSPSEIPSNSSSSSSMMAFYNPNSSVSPTATGSTPPSSSPCTTVANVNTETWSIIKDMMAKNKRQKQEREELQLEQQLNGINTSTVGQNSTMGLLSTTTIDNCISVPNPYDLQHSERIGVFDSTSLANSSSLTNHQSRHFQSSLITSLVTPPISSMSENSRDRNIISTKDNIITAAACNNPSNSSLYSLKNSNEHFHVPNTSSAVPPSLFLSSSSLSSNSVGVNMNKINSTGGAPPNSLIMITGGGGSNGTGSINTSNQLLQTTGRLFSLNSNNNTYENTNSSNIDNNTMVSLPGAYHQSTPSTMVVSQGTADVSASSSFMDSDVVRDFRNQSVDTLTAEQMRTNLATTQEAERLNAITNGNSSNSKNARTLHVINNLQNTDNNTSSNSSSMVMDVDTLQNGNPNLVVNASDGTGDFDSFTQQQQNQQNIFVINTNDGEPNQEYSIAQLQDIFAQQQQQQQQQSQQQQSQQPIQDNDDFPDNLTIDTNMTCQPATLSSLLRDVSPDRSLVTDMDPLTGSCDQGQGQGQGGRGEVEGDVDSWLRTIFVDTPKEPKSGAGGYGVPPLSDL